MALTHLITRAINDGTAILTKTETVTAGSEIRIEEDVPNPSTNLAFAFAFVKTKLKSIYILSDQNLTLKTNSSGSPQETIALLADKPWVWSAGDSYFANPFAGDVTALYVTNAAAAAVLKIRAIVDPT